MSSRINERSENVTAGSVAALQNDDHEEDLQSGNLQRNKPGDGPSEPSSSANEESALYFSFASSLETEHVDSEEGMAGTTPTCPCPSCLSSSTSPCSFPCRQLTRLADEGAGPPSRLRRIGRLLRSGSEIEVWPRLPLVSLDGSESLRLRPW